MKKTIFILSVLFCGFVYADVTMKQAQHRLYVLSIGLPGDKWVKPAVDKKSIDKQVEKDTQADIENCIPETKVSDLNEVVAKCMGAKGYNYVKSEQQK